MSLWNRLPSPPKGRPSDERRRSLRVSRSVPLVIERETGPLGVRTTTLSEHGAMVASPEPFTPGLSLVVRNEKTKQRVKAWVVWSRPGDEPGTFAMALEFLEKASGFWGADYDP